MGAYKLNPEENILLNDSIDENPHESHKYTDDGDLIGGGELNPKESIHIPVKHKKRIRKRSKKK